MLFGGSRLGRHGAEQPEITGLEDWLGEMALEEYLEDVLEWCQEHRVTELKAIQAARLKRQLER